MNLYKLIGFFLFALVLLIACDQLEVIPEDTTGPEISLGQNTEQTIFRSTAAIILNVTDASGIKNITYKLNEGNWIDISNNLTAGVLRFQITDLPLGKHTVTVSITDSKDNQESFALELSHVEDKSLPVLSIVGEDKQISTTADYSIKGSVTDNHAIKLLNYQFNGEERQDITQTITEDSFEIKLNLKEGENKLNIVALDKANNRTEKNLVINYQKDLKDTEKPSLTISNGLDRTIRSNSLEIIGEVKDDIGVSSLSYTLNEAAAKDISSSISGSAFKFILNDIPEGKNALVVTATDQAGNTSSESILITFTNQTSQYPNIEGRWGDRTASSTACNKEQVGAISFVFDTFSQEGIIQGMVNVSNQYGEYVLVGNFVGSIDKSNQITGTAKLKSESEMLSATVNLLKDQSTIKGSMVLKDSYDCSDSLADTELSFELTKNTSLPTVKDDEFEPNDSQEEAKNIDLNKKYDAINYGSSPDWFSFELTEPQLISLEGETDEIFFVVTGKDYYYSGPHEPKYMDKGIYFISIQTYVYSPALYSLKVIANPLPDAQYEPNDSMSQATPLKLGITENLYITPNDEDWFTFTLDKPMIIELVFFSEGGAFGANYKLIDSNSERIDSGYLTLGRYYIQISSGFSSEHHYTLALTASSPSDSSFEPNDSFEDAKAIEINVEYDFLMGYSEDEDWFQFEVDTFSRVTIENPNSQAIHLMIFDETLKGISQSDEVLSAYLEKGKYFLQVTAVHFYASESFEYSLKLLTKNVTDSFEPNNSSEVASLISLNFDDRSLFWQEGDEDWFSFELKSSRLIKFDIKLDDNGLWLNSKLLDESGNQIVHFFDARHNEIILPFGKYYLGLFDGLARMGNRFNYELQIASIKNPEDNFEPNDNLAQAKQIDLNFDNPELFTVRYTSDWFKFDKAQDERVRFAFKKSEQEVYIGLKVYNASGRLINTFGSFTKDQNGFYEILAPKLPSGIIYLEVFSEVSCCSNLIGTNYHLKIEYY